MTPRHETTTRSPSEILIGQLGLARRTRAEVQDMYSRPIRTRVTLISPMAPAAPTAESLASPESQAA